MERLSLSPRGRWLVEAPMNCNIEKLESRCLLSAAPITIPTRVVGETFTGAVHFHFRAMPHIPAHSASAAIEVQLTSLADGNVAGDISSADASVVQFTGPTRRRSFIGVFADGEITGNVSANGRSIHGALRESFNGDIITGTYSVKLPISAKRTRAQTSVATTVTSAGSFSVGGISGAGFSGVEPTVPVLLPALSTSFTTPDALNPNTTAEGVASALSASTPPSGTTTTSNPATSFFNFSPNSGIVSITPASFSFSSTSGLTPLNAGSTFSATSGITGLGI